MRIWFAVTSIRRAEFRWKKTRWRLNTQTRAPPVVGRRHELMRIGLFDPLVILLKLVNQLLRQRHWPTSG
jgi:hypothetical protein